MRSYIASDLKELNRSAVYALLRRQGELSKAEIGRRSGISAPTVMKIVDHFVDSGIASEAGPLEIALGRRPTRIRFEADSNFSIGAQYDGIHLIVGLVDLAGRVRGTKKTLAPPELGEILSNRLADEVEALLGEWGGERERVRGIGIGVPGVVDRESARIRFAPLAGLHESFEYPSFLEGLGERLGFPAFIENDANAAALGEHAARSPDRDLDLAFIEMGRGIGAGLILDGRLRSGRRGLAGEVGYLVMERGWKASAGKAGWFEARMDLASFWEEVERSGAPRQESLSRIVEHLALAISAIALTLDLRLFIIGQAGDRRFGTALLEGLRAALAEMTAVELVCEAPRAEEPGMAGAAGLATEAWLKELFAA